MTAVHVRGACKHYPRGLWGGRVEALRGVDLEVPRGAAFGLIGPNGAGKTTLLKILLGLVRPSAGVAQVLGKDPGDAEVRARIGYLPERLHLPASLTAPAFLRSVGRLRGQDDGLEREVQRQLERVGLSDEQARKLGTFSKGMRQRLGLSAALLGAPELLVLDEPTDGIDPQGRADVRVILQEERKRGATLFLNSHLLDETERVCDEVCVLVGGQAVRSGRLEDVCGDPACYAVRFAGSAPREALLSLGFTPGERDGMFQVPARTPEELHAQLDAARRAGALAVELSPRVRTLEDVLLQLIERHDA